MKECEQISDLFGELHEGRVDPQFKKLATEHLDKCTCCREEFKWYGFTVQALGNLEKVSPPAEFMVRLRAGLYDSSPSSPVRDFFRTLFTSSPSMPLPVGLAALTAIVVVGFVIYNNSPLDLLPTGVAVTAVQGSAVASSAGTQAKRVASGGVHTDPMHQGTTVVSLPNPVSSTSPGTPSQLIASTPNTWSNNLTTSAYIPTVADTIGADNLTVESASVDQAVESLKRILPNIRGRLVLEKPRPGIGERMLGVVIPSNAYGSLTTELVNHGAVAAGVGTEVSAPTPSKTDANNVILYIRFVQAQ
jgi:hypothetical protein